MVENPENPVNQANRGSDNKRCMINKVYETAENIMIENPENLFNHVDHG